MQPKAASPNGMQVSRQPNHPRPTEEDQSGARRRNHPSPLEVDHAIQKKNLAAVWRRGEVDHTVP